MCNKVWLTRNDFLDDPQIELNGYQADFEKLEYGLFYFTHYAPECHSTMAIETREFLDLYSGVKYTERKTLTDDCPRYCTEKEQLNRCDALCECAFVREVIQIIKER
jgi:hypothetical protein